MNKNNDFLTAKEVAEQLRVMPRTVHKLIKRQKLKGLKVGRRYLIERGDIYNYMHGLAKE